MNWLIFIHFYLWQNSSRRWLEQPLSLLSKLVIAGLLGILGAFIILGTKELGKQIDKRLTDRDILTCIITETVPKEDALAKIQAGITDSRAWKTLDGEVLIYFQAAAFAEVENGMRLPIIGVENPEEHGMVDDIYLLDSAAPINQRLEFQIDDFSSEAVVRRPSTDEALLLNRREGLIGGIDRLSAIFIRGYTQTVVFKAKSIEGVQKAHQVTNAFSRLEAKRIFIQSNLQILLELKKIRAIQAQALIWITVGSAAVLGLVFGSLTWMEFREERYLLALIRSFGIGSLSLFLHALIENTLLALVGVLLGFFALTISVNFMQLEAMNMVWLRSADTLIGGDGLPLLMGAALGGILSSLPVAIGLRKPLGLILT